VSSIVSSFLQDENESNKLPINIEAKNVFRMIWKFIFFNFVWWNANISLSFSNEKKLCLSGIKLNDNQHYLI
jgi:hypothetical protein